MWGSQAELQYLRLQQQLQPDAAVVVVSEDYHVPRLVKLATRKVGLVAATFLKAPSHATKPSRRAIVHEWLGLAEASVPDWVMVLPKLLRKVGLRARIIGY